MKSDTRSLFINILFLLIFTIQLVATTRTVWTTLSPDQYACHHILYPGEQHYELWFDDLCQTLVDEFGQSIVLQQTVYQVFVERPAFIFCGEYIVHVYLDTARTTAEINGEMQRILNKVKEDRGEEFSLIWTNEDMLEAALRRERDDLDGRYVVDYVKIPRESIETDNQIVAPIQMNRHVLRTHERHLILNVMRRLRIPVTRGWREDGCIVLLVRGGLHEHLISRFQRILQSAFRYPVSIRRAEPFDNGVNGRDGR